MSFRYYIMLTQVFDKLVKLYFLLQPLLLFEAIMRPMSDLKALSQNLMVMSTTHNVPFSNLIYEVLRGMLISVAQRPGLQTLKVDAFVMIKLPLLLEKLYHLHLKQVRSTFVRPLIVFLFFFQKLIAQNTVSRILP